MTLPTPTPDSAAARGWLSQLYPQGPWCLTALGVDKKSIETVTFYSNADDIRLLDNWLAHHNGRSNCYYHINPVLRAVTKKAERADIASVNYLHVDLDCQAGQDVETEKRRILGLLTSPPAGVPAPTYIVGSGGGCQALWRLREPIPVGGDLARAEDAKRYNLGLERAFKADNVHNIDRILRLPGTVNIPDAKKVKKGRVPCLATVIVSAPDRVYDIAQFVPAVAVQGGVDGLAGGAGAVQLSGNIERLADVAALEEWGVPDRIKVIIVQGHNPDEPKQGDNSRSAWLFDCVCGLLRCNVPAEVVFSVITDKDFLISASVLECGANAEKYALRQIERAKEEIVEPWLRKLNERFAVIGNIGGKCRVIEEVMDLGLDRARLTKQSFEDFSNRFMNQFATVGKDKNGEAMLMPVGKWWLRNGSRRQYDTIVFAPGRETPGCYNLWKGFACEAVPGDCGLYLKHMRDNICGGIEEHYEYLLNWMARAVQQPDSPGQIAVVLRGKQGTGKSILVKTFGGLFGRHYFAISDAKHLTGNFNAHLRDCVVLFGEEAFYAGDKRHEATLKMLITEEVIAVEAKGVDVEATPNYVHLLMASNSQWVVPAGPEERRFFVLDVGDAAKQDSVYFQALVEQLKRGGREALLHTLLTRDLSRFEVRNVPKTKALAEQKLLSLSAEEEWWYRKLTEGRILEDQEGWVPACLKQEVTADYLEYMRSMNVSRRANETLLGKFLHRICPGLGTYQAPAILRIPVGNEGWTREVKRRAYYFQFPPLDVCRKKWCELYNAEPFPEIVAQEVLSEADTAGNEADEPF